MASMFCETSVIDNVTSFDNMRITESLMEPNETASPSILFGALKFAMLIIFKIILHFSTSSIINYSNPKKEQLIIFPCILWFICQVCISWINTIRFPLFLSMNIVLILIMVLLNRINSEKKLFLAMGLTELFWLYHCNDISCIAAYIFIFEGCFVQRIKDEYTECELWSDRHLLQFVVAKIVFISWIYISLNWITAFLEFIYFVVPTLSLKYNPFKLNFDQWFFVDGCSHISLFCVSLFFSNIYGAYCKY